MENDKDIVVDLDLWLAWLESLHNAFPHAYANPDVALKGFYEDWDSYVNIIDTIKKGKHS